MRPKLVAQLKRRVIRICTDSEINGTEKSQRLSLAEQGNRNHPNDVSTYKFAARQSPATAARACTSLQMARRGITRLVCPDLTRTVVDSRPQQ
jgi:hypothetical protein